MVRAARYTSPVLNRLLNDKYQPWLVAVLYSLVTIWMLWPLPLRAGSALENRGDPLFEVWVMRAVQHRLVHDPLDLYQANIFHPFDNTLAWSEEAISTALLAWPIYLLTGNDILAYNLMLIFSFWLLAFAIYLLARELGAAPGAAVVAGIVAAFAPARYGQLSHLHMLVFGSLPLAFWALTVYARGGRGHHLALASVALTVLLLGSLHWAVFGTIALTLYLLFLLLRERRARHWGRRQIALSAVALVVPYLLLFPTLLPHLAVSQEYDFVRSREEITALSAEPRDYLSVWFTNTFWTRWLTGSGEPAQPLFPGAVALVGAGLAVLWRRRWPVWFAATLTATATIVAFGFAVRVGSWSIPLPYTIIYDLVSPIQSIRVVGRYALLLTIGLPLLAAFGYTASWQRLRARGATAALGLALTAVLSVGAMVELRSTPNTIPAPNNAQEMAVYDWLAEQSPGVVMEYPSNSLFYGSRDPVRLVWVIEYMYGSTRHWNPIVAGFSGFWPDAHIQLLAQFGDPNHEPSAVTASTVGLLQELDVRWVIFHARPGYDIQTAISQADTLPELRRVADVNTSVVYELAPSDREPLDSGEATVEISPEAAAGGFFPVRFRITNPRDNRSILHLDAPPSLAARWLDSDGNTVRTERLDVPVPAVVNPGETIVEVLLQAPDEPGNYTVHVSLDRTAIPDASQQVEVYATTIGDSPILRLESVEWDAADPRPGETVPIDVTWTVIETPESNFAATVQVLDASGTRIAGSDLLPNGGMPPTSEWQPGQQVTLTFPLVLDPAIPPGDYQLLTAVYAYRPDFPRLLVERPDGSVATEVTVSGFRIQP